MGRLGGIPEIPTNIQQLSWHSDQPRSRSFPIDPEVERGTGERLITHPVLGKASRARFSRFLSACLTHTDPVISPQSLSIVIPDVPKCGKICNCVSYVRCLLIARRRRQIRDVMAWYRLPNLSYNSSAESWFENKKILVSKQPLLQPSFF